MGKVTINIENRSGSFPYTLNLKYPSGQTLTYKATAFPYIIEDLPSGQYVLNGKSKEGICQPSTTFTINTIDCNNIGNINAPSTTYDIHCTDEAVNILPTIGSGFSILSSSIQSGEGSDNHDANYTFWTFTPSANQVGQTILTYQLTDGNETVTGTIVINVTCEEILPCSDPFNAPTLYVDVECNKVIQLLNFTEIANANGGNNQFTVEEVLGEEHGQITYNIVTGFSYVALAGFSGTDTLSYTIQNRCGDLATGTIIVNVTCNDELFAPNLQMTVLCDANESQIIFNAERELEILEANPQLPYLETDATTQQGNGIKEIQFIDISDGEHGTVEHEPSSGKGFAYTLNNGTTGVEDVLTYILKDFNGNTATGQIFITIDQTNCNVIDCQNKSIVFVLDATGSMTGGLCAKEQTCGNKIAEHNYTVTNGVINESGTVILDDNYCLKSTLISNTGQEYGTGLVALDYVSSLNTKTYIEDTFTSNILQNLSIVAIKVEVHSSTEPTKKTCFDRAKDAIIEGVQYLDIDNTANELSVISFNDTATVNQALTSTGEASVISIINSLVNSGQTNICDGLDNAVTQLSGANAANEKIVILLTDGDPNTGGCNRENTLSRMETMKGNGIKIVTIGLNLDANSFTNQSQCSGFVEADGSGNMMFCGASSAGDYYEITTETKMKDLFADIFSDLC